MHHKTNREDVDIFMKCSKWQGDITNQEPHKCGGLKFHNINKLANNIVDYVSTAIQMINSKIIYSELGWGNEVKSTENSSVVN